MYDIIVSSLQIFETSPVKTLSNYNNNNKFLFIQIQEKYIYRQIKNGCRWRKFMKNSQKCRANIGMASLQEPVIESLVET